jgi:hypothetical protein
MPTNLSPSVGATDRLGIAILFAMTTLCKPVSASDMNILSLISTPFGSLHNFHVVTMAILALHKIYTTTNP